MPLFYTVYLFSITGCVSLYSNSAYKTTQQYVCVWYNSFFSCMCSFSCVHLDSVCANKAQFYLHQVTRLPFYLITKVKGRVHCFSLQVVMNKYFL